MMMYCKRQFIDLMVETRHTDLQSGAKERRWFTYHKFFFFFFFFLPAGQLYILGWPNYLWMGWMADIEQSISCVRLNRHPDP